MTGRVGMTGDAVVRGDAAFGKALKVKLVDVPTPVPTKKGRRGALFGRSYGTGMAVGSSGAMGSTTAGDVALAYRGRGFKTSAGTDRTLRPTEFARAVRQVRAERGPTLHERIRERDMYRVSKSFVPGKGYVSAVDVPVRQLRELAHGGRAKAAYQSYLKDNEHWDAVRASTKAKSRFAATHGGYHSTKGAVRPNVLAHSQVQSAVGNPAADAFAFKTGSRKAGKGHVFTHPATPQHILSHEAAHVAPKRSSYRFHQVTASPRLTMREEARADYMAGIHYKDKKDPGRGSGYAEAASDNLKRKFHYELSGKRKMFNRPSMTGYRDVQDRMRYAGTKPSKVTKRDRGRDSSGALVGTGSVLGTAGLLGGGVPGARPDSGRLAQVRYGTKYEASRHLVSATRGGIFGYRADAHQSFLNRQNADEKRYAGTKTSRTNHYLRGQGSGKIGPEKHIIRHMKAGRAVSNVALLGGTAMAVAGSRGHNRRVGKRDNYTADVLATGGGSTAALGGGGALLMEHQGRKWSRRSAASLDAARKLNPKLGGYDVERNETRVPDVKPHLTGSEHVKDKKIFAGRSNKHTSAAGAARGAALQERYFARVYGKMGRHARKAGLAGALVGSAGLGAKYLQNRSGRMDKSLARPKGVGIRGEEAITDNRGQIQFLSQLPDAHRPKVSPRSAKPAAKPAEAKLVQTARGGLNRKHVALGLGTLTAAELGGYAVRRHRHPQPVAKVDTTMSERQAHHLASQYDTKGPLPKGLDRESKMKAYEARYIAAGGKKGEKWKHRAQHAEVGRNLGLVGATTSAAALLATRGRRAGPAMARHKVLRHATPHRLESAALGSALGGGWSELYGEHARSRRASYSNSPAGIAGSALTRMRAYTPERRTP